MFYTNISGVNKLTRTSAKLNKREMWNIKKKKKITKQKNLKKRTCHSGGINGCIELDSPSMKFTGRKQGGQYASNAFR